MTIYLKGGHDFFRGNKVDAWATTSDLICICQRRLNECIMICFCFKPIEFERLKWLFYKRVTFAKISSVYCELLFFF